MKYNTGYVAGVFDLFHIGHLNLLKNAKQMCNKLLVGVLCDELVIKFKYNPPIIPETERLEIIRSLKCVDDALIIDGSLIDKIYAWNAFHFDCLFSGDDWKDNDSWINDQQKLRELGSDIYFFPYTSCTSSSKIKKLISKADEQQEKLLIFGAGTYGKRALEYYGSSVIAFIDNDIEKQGKIICGKPCLDINKISDCLDETYTIIVAMKNDKESIMQMLKSNTRANIRYYI